MKRLWNKLRGKRRSRKYRPVQGTPTFENLEPRLLLNAVPYIQDFSLGKPNAAAGWDFNSNNEGRIEVVSGRLRMDDTAGNSVYSLNEGILHIDLTNKTGVTLTLDHWNLSDENDSLPDSFVGQYKGDGISLSVDGQNWVKVTDLTISFSNQTFALDPIIEQAKIAANSSDLSDVQIKFQQYDNYSASTDGREFDNIKIQATTVVPQVIPYSQNFSSGKPDAAAGWEYYSDNEGRIAVVNGRLRLDDTTGNTNYSLNEAILHLNLIGKTGVTLTLDHWSLADEVDGLPASFVGHYKGDGIALSVDGQNWVKITDLSVNFTNKTFNLDTIIQQAMTAAGSTDISNVRIKFQQYDNYPASSDGREFDNIVITSVVNQAPVITSVTASPSAISDTETSQLQVNAYDPDSGPNALTYSWTLQSGQGTLSNYNIANPIYTPPDVSSPQTFTLTVKVSDGAATTTKTVNITVTDTIIVNQAPVITSVTASPS
ncbi:MAG: cadherin repeat domain-containing protein, partial [Sedimentisphaerales bacterium]|nr:cadherin repeat domain-containing protein [Sedimentisphaerales bacterium]